MIVFFVKFCYVADVFLHTACDLAPVRNPFCQPKGPMHRLTT